MSSIPDDQLPRTYHDIPDEDIGTFYPVDIEFPDDELRFYLLDDANGIFIRKPEQDIEEIKRYGRKLTDDERLNLLLRPPKSEVQKAESTIELLSTLQEVGLI